MVKLIVVRPLLFIIETSAMRETERMELPSTNIASIIARFSIHSLFMLHPRASNL